jgi:hypothetical protein
LAVRECLARGGVDDGHRHWDGVRRGLAVRCHHVDDDGVCLLEGACGCSGGDRCGKCVGRDAYESIFVCSCDTMGTFASLVWLGSAGVVVIGTLGGVLDMGTLGGSAVVGNIGGVTVYVGTLGGVALILLKSSGSLLTVAIASLETLWNGAGGGEICWSFFRFNAGMTMRYFCVSAGVLHFVGNNSTVSDMRSLPVSITYTL